MALTCSKCDTVIDDELPRLAESAKVLCPRCHEPLTLPEMTIPVAFAQPPLEGPPVGLDPDKRYALLVVSGPEAGKVLDIEKKVVTIGRAGCDLLLEDAEISRRHAIVEISGDEATLQDLDSTNGTFVNDERIGQAVLENRDKFRVGSHEIALVVTDRE